MKQSMHLDLEQVQRHLHGELSPPAEASVREHLAGCADCRGRVVDAEREEDEVFALLRGLDHSPPRVSAHELAARANARRFNPNRWAAGLLVALGLAGAVYAAPGSPLKAWAKAAAGWIEARLAPAPVAPVPEVPPPAEDRGASGIAVAPGLKLVILFTSHQAEGQAQVSLTDGDQVVVRGPIGAATFTSDADRLVVNNHGSPATFEIQIPRAAPQIEIRVEGDRIFLKEGSRITTPKSVEGPGPYLLPLTPPGP
jgi:hypothetical protein